MSNVTPIRPDLPPPAPPAPSLKDRIETECRRIYQAAAVVELAEGRVGAFSGDEDSLTIVEELTVPSGALRSARALLVDIVERLEGIAHEAQEARPA